MSINTSFKQLKDISQTSLVVQNNLPANAGDIGSIPGLEKSHIPWATEPLHHNYWAHTLKPTSWNYEAHAPRARALQQEKPPQWEACTLQQRVAPTCHN